MNDEELQSLISLLDKRMIKCITKKALCSLVEYAFRTSNPSILHLICDTMECQKCIQPFIRCSLLLKLCKIAKQYTPLTPTRINALIRLQYTLSYGGDGKKIVNLILQHEWKYGYWPRTIQHLTSYREDNIQLCLKVYDLLDGHELSKQLLYCKDILENLIETNRIQKYRKHYLDIYNNLLHNTPTKILEELYKPHVGELWQRQVNDFATQTSHLSNFSL